MHTTFQKTYHRNSKNLNKEDEETTHSPVDKFIFLMKVILHSKPKRVSDFFFWSVFFFFLNTKTILSFELMTETIKTFQKYYVCLLVHIALSIVCVFFSKTIYI